MIHVNSPEPNTRSWRRWTTECKAATRKASEEFRRCGRATISALYRRKSVKQSFFFSKSGPFRGRCAYCECYIADFQHGDIEHFRPKAGVTDENDIAIKIVAPDGTTREHPGYYWLAYEWRNLLPSCVVCNQPGDGGIGKRNRFPLENGSHATIPSELGSERPLLLNPYEANDDPEQHLSIDPKSGHIITKNTSRRGKACIDIFGLNVRDQLVKSRKSAIDEVKAKFVQVIMGDNDARTAAQRALVDMQDGEYEHTLARRWAIKDTLNNLPFKK